MSESPAWKTVTDFFDKYLKQYYFGESGVHRSRHVSNFLVSGDKVVVLGTSREGPKGSGRLVDFRWVHVFTFGNGRIVAFEEPADVCELVTEFRIAAFAATHHGSTPT